jgi:ketosteroid isomerase-like protein
VKGSFDYVWLSLRKSQNYAQDDRWFEVTLLESDEQEIVKLFEDGDRALMSANVAELRRIYADDYVQYDETGRIIMKQDLIRDLTSGAVRLVSMKSTGRCVRMLRDDVAIVHGSEDDEIEQDGKRFEARYIYMDVVMKRNGRWQIVASQLARVK